MTLLLAGCSGEEGGAGGRSGSELVSTWTDGSRLAARVLDAGGGVVVFASFFDTDLGIPCHFQQAADGTLRCLPNGHDAAFIDDACTAPAVPVGCLGPEAAAVRHEDDPCNASIDEALVPSGEAVQANVFRAGAVSCVDNGGPYAMAPAERVPFDRFVEGVQEAIPIGDGIAALRIVAADGATQVTGHLRGAVPCEPVRVGATLRCVDVARYRLGAGLPTYFGGAGCTGPEQVPATLDCPALPEPTLAERDGSASCGGTFHALGPSADHGWAHRDGRCSSADAPGSVFFPIEDVVPPRALPAFTETDVGDGRVVVRERRLAGVMAVGDAMDAVMHDSVLDVACRPALDAAGVFRCLPGGAAPVAYADAECTVPLFSGDDEGDACGHAEDRRFLRVTAADCGWTLGGQRHAGGVVTHVLERGARYHGPAYQRWEGCRPSSMEQALYAVGATHPVEAFPVLELR